jgi:hypothetical protein
VHVFIDDSGDAGFKLDRGSTEFFVIACCVFETPDAAERTSKAIIEHRASIGWSEFEEFKFSKMRNDLQFDFMNEIFKLDFFVRAIVIDKKIIESSNLMTNHKNFYNYVIKMVLTRSNRTIQDASVKIDGSSGREYRNAVRTYLKNEANTEEFRVIKDVNFVNSKGNQLIQLADMVAGCIRRSVDLSKNNAPEYAAALAPIHKKIKSDIWYFK